MKKIKYSRRLFGWVLGYSLLMMACVVVFQYLREKEYKVNELNARLQVINTYILNELHSGVPIDDITVNSYHSFRELRISIINESDGRIVYDNTLDSIPDSNHLQRREIAAAIRSGSGFSVRRVSSSTGETYFYSATADNAGRIVRTAVPYSVALSSLLQPDRSFIWVTGIITVLMCVIGFFATRRLGKTIARLSVFAENAEMGSQITDFKPFPHDELGEISNNIVRLYARLQQANIERDKEHSAALFEAQEKERIKKQLTNNINHELKTPVASIRVCIETLLEHDDIAPRKREEFLRRCLANTDRLSRLLADVALITRIDDGGTAIQTCSVDLQEIIDEVVEDALPLAQARDIKILNDVAAPIKMQGNASLLYSVFHNLVDNAIVHSGCTVVSIKVLSRNSEEITIEVADNGRGIEPEHLSRIFERFYRIDKGRSRASGGTGLGLSIVKNVIAFHGGSIEASLRVAGGLQFTINLPCS